MEITAEAQGNYPTFKQKLAEKENFVISIVCESQLLIGKCRLKATRFQKLTTRALSKEIRIQKQKIFPKTLFFFDKSSQKSRFKGISRNPKNT